MGYKEALMQIGILIFFIIFFIIIERIYFGKKDPEAKKEAKKKIGHWISSWGLAIIGIILTLIQIAIYFLDKIQFELPQLIIAFGMIAMGIYYIFKYRNEDSEITNIRHTPKHYLIS